jgi:glutathione S-transferase
MMLATPAMAAVGLVTLLALVLFLWVTTEVSRARGKYKVAAPAIDGPPEFERTVRVQTNTLEQLVPFLAALWLSAAAFHAWLAAAVGVVWLIGRVLYALAYWRDPAKRGTGFVVGSIATVALMILALIGIVQRLIA